MDDISGIGAVVIGRNEGSRLVACLESIPAGVEQVIYVDSGSTDDSLAQARKAGAKVVELNLEQPFTAARARNAGFQALIADQSIRFVQFVDGDCVVQRGWFEVAGQFLAENPATAVVCGRRRERYPDNTIFNRLCDTEWNTPVGQADACGGDAMMRVDALLQVEGYRDTMIAGEEPELCVRLRTIGWQIWRLDAEMTLHDANITHLGQWWKRARRSGHAFAEGAALHGAPPERHNVRAIKRILAWGVALPTTLLLAALLISPWALAGFLIYPLQVTRIALRQPLRNRIAWEYAFFLVLGNIPEAIGVLEYQLRRWRGKPAGIIEYK